MHFIHIFFSKFNLKTLKRTKQNFKYIYNERKTSMVVLRVNTILNCYHHIVFSDLSNAAKTVFYENRTVNNIVHRSSISAYQSVKRLILFAGVKC